MALKLQRWTALLIVLFPLFAVAQFREKSAGAAIEEATHEAAAQQAHSEKTEKTGANAEVKVLTDTKGFHVEAYLDNVIPRVRESWYGAIHELVNKPEEKTGTVTVGFTIVRSGEVQDVHVVHGSGEQDLDEAACQGVERTSPLPPLPKAVPPDQLKLTLHFFYKGVKPRWWRRK